VEGQASEPKSTAIGDICLRHRLDLTVALKWIAAAV